MSASSEESEPAGVDVGGLLDAGAGGLVTLVAGDSQLQAHRAVLAAGSPVFAAMLGHDTLEAGSGRVEIPDVAPPVLRQLLSYLYTLRAPQLPAVAGPLLVAADKYGVAGLKVQCEQQLASQLRVETAADTALLAVRHSCPRLTEAAVAFIAAHPQVLDTQAWAQAALSHPREVAELRQLLPQTKTSTAGGMGPFFNPPPEPDAVSRMRSLPEEERNTRLFLMAQMGAVEEVRALLAAGADVEAADRAFCWMTALHWAAIRGHAEVVRCLVQAGAAVDAPNSVGRTPLHASAHCGHLAAVRALLAASADPNARNQWGRTPLHDAAEQGHAEVVAALLEAGADRGARTDSSCTALDLAIGSRKQEAVHVLTCGRRACKCPGNYFEIDDFDFFIMFGTGTLQEQIQPH